MPYTSLKDRTVISISGSDRKDFLQGIITNDINLVTTNKSIYACLLTPQGKFLFDFFILEGPEQNFLLECDKEDCSGLIKRFKMYKLRSDIQIKEENYRVVAIFNEEYSENLPMEEGQVKPLTDTGYVYRDPRLDQMGWRALLINDYPLDYKEVLNKEYEYHRILHGVPKSRMDLIPNKSTLLECNIDLLNGISWDKGCYIGQEVTARMKYRGLLKKRLYPITSDQNTRLDPGADLFDENQKRVGEVRSCADNHAIALLRDESINDDEVHTGKEYDCIRINIKTPIWLKNRLDQRQ